MNILNEIVEEPFTISPQEMEMLTESINSEDIIFPKGLTREQRRDFRKEALKEQAIDYKEAVELSEAIYSNDAFRFENVMEIIKQARENFEIPGTEIPVEVIKGSFEDFDKWMLTESINSGDVIIPKGLTREQRREFIRQEAKKRS
jgi:hypothetical protein